MLNKIKNRKQEGFTIIEVLIVLAIAGLIMLIVFLAVPALQRNSRNTQRTNDASRTSAAVTECLNNNNGKKEVCDEFSGSDKLKDYIKLEDNQQLSETAAGVSGLTLNFGSKCNDAGTELAPGGGNRAFAVFYSVETSGGEATRCLSS